MGAARITQRLRQVLAARITGAGTRFSWGQGRPTLSTLSSHEVPIAEALMLADGPSTLAP
jgi:hypothetical protein